MSDIIWTNTTIKLGDLKPWTQNPRQSTKKQARKLLESWEKFGQVQTIAVDPEGNVLDGHQRLSALLTVHGNAYRVDARQSNRALTEDERKELVITLHAGAVGAWDWDSLSGWDAPDLMEWGFSQETLADWKRDVGALGNLLESEKPGESADAEPQIDRAAELQEKWQVQPGELFEIGAHRLICGDCTDGGTVAKLMGGEKADLWIADPPYGIDWKGSNASTLEWEGIEGDRDTDLVARFIPLIPSEQQAVVFGANCFPSLLPHRGRWICWDKRVTEEADRMIGSPFELAWMNKTHGFDVIVRVQHGGALNADGGKRFHPTQKPVALYTTIITTAYKDIKSIYDPFSGSGTTMIASQNLNRVCYGCEIEQKFAAVILERMTTAFPDLPVTRYPVE